MTTAIVQRQDLTLDKFRVIQELAPTIKASRLFGVATDDQAASIMVKGWELGFSLSSSFEFITVIQDKPVLVPKGMMALIMNSPVYDSHKIVEEVDAKKQPYSCTVTMKRKNGFEFTTTFTMDDAKRAGLVKEGGAWTAYPANMLRYRALGYCADQVFPDILGGLKRSDEFGSAVSEAGEIIDIEVTPVASTPTAAPVEEESAKPDSATYLNELVQHYGAEAIISANEGKIPATLEECEAVEDKLRGKNNGSSAD